MNAIFCALVLGVVSDAAFSSTGIWSVLPGYIAIVGHGVTSTVLDHTYAVLSPGLGPTFTIAATNLGASLFALPFYIFRTVIVSQERKSFLAFTYQIYSLDSPQHQCFRSFL